MIKATAKVGVSMAEVLRISRKFTASWTPPAGYTLEGNWGAAGGTAFALVSADPYSALVEGCAQFATALDLEIFPVVELDELLPAQDAGLTWALAE